MFVFTLRLRAEQEYYVLISVICLCLCLVVFNVMGPRLLLVLYILTLIWSLWLLKWTGISSYLCFGQHEWGGHFKAFGSGEVFVELELVLQLQQLLTGEGGARPPALPQQTGLGPRWRRKRYVILILWQLIWYHRFMGFLLNCWHAISKYFCFDISSNIYFLISALLIKYVDNNCQPSYLFNAKDMEVQYAVASEQAHICPHSLAIINYNSFTPVYCWRGDTAEAGEGP